MSPFIHAESFRSILSAATDRGGPESNNVTRKQDEDIYWFQLSQPRIYEKKDYFYTSTYQSSDT